MVLPPGREGACKKPRTGGSATASTNGANSEFIKASLHAAVAASSASKLTKLVEAGESEYSRVLKTCKLLISRPAKNAEYYKIAPNWNVSGTWFFRPPEKFSDKDFTFRGPQLPRTPFPDSFRADCTTIPSGSTIWNAGE
jgi:hypothetical protein